MRNDPIVEEVHRIREKMWDACGGDLDRLIRSLRASERLHPERIITRKDVEKIRQKSNATRAGA